MTLPLPIPIEVVYAGLAGTLLALIVATAQQKWQWKVFFLLALRLAIGWHFLFEGLHKIHSHTVGPTETNKPFSSEPYFKASPTWFGAQMRKRIEDTDRVFAERLTPPTPMDPKAFAALTVEEQAARCPSVVAMELDLLEQQAAESVKAAAEADAQAAPADYEKAMKAIAEDEQKAAKDAAGPQAAKDKADAARAAAATTRDTAADDARKRIESSAAAAKELIVAAKAKYARWVYGAEGRDTKVKYVTGPVPLTAPQRLAHLDAMRQELETAEAQRGVKLGTGNGTEMKRVADLRTELVAAESELAADARAFVAELRADMGVKPEEKPAKEIRFNDRATAWFIAVVGACLLFGFLTRLSCVLAAGFLVTTYLTWPSYPWLPQPPNTEGNPLFINKNIIECLAVLSLACMPTGRWLGLDAIIHRFFTGKQD